MTYPHKFLAFVLDNSILLLAGTGAAVLWANVDPRGSSWWLSVFGSTRDRSSPRRVRRYDRVGPALRHPGRWFGPYGADAGVGHPLRDRHRVQLLGGAFGLRAVTSRGALPLAPRHRG